MHCAMTDFALRNKLAIIASVKLDELLGALIRAEPKLSAQIVSVMRTPEALKEWVLYGAR